MQNYKAKYDIQTYYNININVIKDIKIIYICISAFEQL